MSNLSSYRACLDLFGDVAVTTDDVEFWLDVVPKIPRTSPRRREYYAKAWDVVNKIKHSKLSGEFYRKQEEAAADLEYITNHRLGAAFLVASRGNELR